MQGLLIVQRNLKLQKRPYIFFISRVDRLFYYIFFSIKNIKITLN
jgi:hypothetical protein